MPDLGRGLIWPAQRDQFSRDDELREDVEVRAAEETPDYSYHQGSTTASMAVAQEALGVAFGNALSGLGLDHPLTRALSDIRHDVRAARKLEARAFDDARAAAMKNHTQVSE